MRFSGLVFLVLLLASCAPQAQQGSGSAIDNPEAYVASVDKAQGDFGFIVGQARTVSSVQDFAGLRICVQSNSLSERALIRTMSANGVSYTPVLLAPEALVPSYQSNDCDALALAAPSLPVSLRQLGAGHQITGIFFGYDGKIVVR